jgi:GNAT superfamily N-acetyltransferase
MNFPIDFEPDLSAEDEKTIYEGLLAHNVEDISLPVEEIRTKRFAFVFRQDGEIKAGLIGANKYTSAFVDTLWVDKSLRAQGLGRALLKKAEDYAAQNRCTVIFLNTLTPANVHFYEKSGYVFEFERPGYVAEHAMRHFRKVLP